MFNEILKDKFEYLTNYFETAIKAAKADKRALVHSVILYGQDSLAQYYLAQEISRIMNCKSENGGGNPDCTCINCNWVRQNQHPAVLTVSKNDNNPNENGKLINRDQAHHITQNLIKSSDYYRVFIFCDSEIGDLTESQKVQIQNYAGLNQSLAQENWFPYPLKRNTIHDVAANALLKSIEEPPENLLFIFLTEDQENIIETIVSRSQSFYVPSFARNAYDYDLIQTYMNGYPVIGKGKVQSIAEGLLASAEEKGYSLNYVLDSMEFYFAELLKSNLNNKNFIQQIKKDILKIQHSKKQAAAYIKPHLVLENLLFEFC